MKTAVYFYAIILLSSTLSATDYSNESSPDMLSPDYYNAGEEDSIRLITNSVISLTREEGLHHPLLGESLPNYSIFRDFGDLVGRNNNYQYHPARDFYVENKATLVNIYAAHDGLIDTCTNITKYRHHISITCPILSKEGEEIAKLTTIYAHVDLDSNMLALQDGDFVKKGDLICTHLYSGTMGGPHLHFEIRFYDKNAEGTEEFYGWAFSTPSSGPWEYGYWDTSIGLGYGNPDNYISDENTAIQSTESLALQVYPNPTKGKITFPFDTSQIIGDIKLYQLNGNLLETLSPALSNCSTIDLSHYPDGYYLGFFEIANGNKYSFKVLKRS